MQSESATSPQPAEGAQGFFARLFDLSFDTFITTSLIKVLYVLQLVGAGLGALFVLLAMATAGGAGIVLGIIVAPVAFLLWAILSRVWVEMLIVTFKIAENTDIIARNSNR